MVKAVCHQKSIGLVSPKVGHCNRDQKLLEESQQEEEQKISNSVTKPLEGILSRQKEFDRRLHVSNNEHLKRPHSFAAINENMLRQLASRSEGCVPVVQQDENLSQSSSFNLSSIGISNHSNNENQEE